MNSQLISSIHIENLFGLYTYSLPQDDTLCDASILYGDNGVGKSTILRLVFHLLSPAKERGHRNALYNEHYKSLTVTLASGITLSASKEEELVVTRTTKKHNLVLGLTIKKNDKIIAAWDFIPQNQRNEEDFWFQITQNLSQKSTKKTNVKYGISEEHIGEEPYLSALFEYAPTIFMLNADRRLDSDSISDPGDEVELRRFMRLEEAKRLKDLIARSRQIALVQALSSANRWISNKAVISANRGSENVHSVYVDVLNRLISSSEHQKPEIEINLKDLKAMLSAIESRTQELSIYELATPLSTLEFRKSLSTHSPEKKTLAADLLSPYIKSLMSRLSAIDSIYQVIDKFIKTINSFLTDKEISYKVSQGFSISNSRNQPLDPDQLSSGEQQLLLLFCYILTGRDKPCIFMVDEPEISLNIKWQRKLIQSLLDITEGSDIQFIFASHSMELLAQHRNRVVKLVNNNV